MKRLHMHNPKTMMAMCNGGGISPRWTTNILDVSCKQCNKKMLSKLKNGSMTIHEDRSGSMDPNWHKEFLKNIEEFINFTKGDV